MPCLDYLFHIECCLLLSKLDWIEDLVSVLLSYTQLLFCNPISQHNTNLWNIEPCNSMDRTIMIIIKNTLVILVKQSIAEVWSFNLVWNIFPNLMLAVMLFGSNLRECRKYFLAFSWFPYKLKIVAYSINASTCSLFCSEYNNYFNLIKL